MALTPVNGVNRRPGAHLQRLWAGPTTATSAGRRRSCSDEAKRGGAYGRGSGFVVRRPNRRRLVAFERGESAASIPGPSASRGGRERAL
jgi:hypothetical protein